MNHPPGMPHRKQLYAVIAARPPRRTLQGCTPAERPVEPAGSTVPDRARDCAVWAGCQAACAEAAGLGCGADRPMCAHMHPAAHGRRACATAGRTRAFCCCCCCCWHAPAAAAAAAPPIPPGGPQPPGAASESRGGSNPVVPSFVRCCPARNFGMRALATACSGADDLRLSERSSSRKCSDCRQSQAASKGLERDAICETEESEAAGAGSRREAERCMWGWGKGLGWDFLRLPWLT